MGISRLVFVVVCLGSLVLLQNCGPGECEEHVPTHTKYTISSDDKSKIPFTGTDTLVYISTDGDTAILYGQEKKAFTESVQKNSGGDPSCPRIDYNDFENLEFTYKGNNSDLNTIFIDFNASVYSPEQTNADFLINSKKYKGYLGFISNELNYNDTLTLLDNKTYHGIDAEIFYNYHYGLLRVVTTHKTWLLMIN